MSELLLDKIKSCENIEELFNNNYCRNIEKNEKYKDLFMLLNKKENGNINNNKNNIIVFNSNIKKTFKNNNNKYNKYQYKIRNIELDNLSPKERNHSQNNEIYLINKKLLNIYKDLENTKTKKINILIPSTPIKKRKKINDYIGNTTRNKNNFRNCFTNNLKNNIDEKISLRNTFSTDFKIPKQLNNNFENNSYFNTNSNQNYIKNGKINDWVKNEKKNQINDFYKNKKEEITSLLNIKDKKYNLKSFNRIKFNSDINSNPNVLLDIQKYNIFYNNEIRKFSNKLNKTNKNKNKTKRHKKSYSLIGNYFKSD